VPLLFLPGLPWLIISFFGAWSFFLSFEASAAVCFADPDGRRVSEYLSLAMSLIFAFGLAFQMPIFGAILANFGVIKADFWAKNRRFGVVLIFVFAAIATPPDVFSQLALAFPMMGLYEVTIWIARLVEKGKKKRKEI
jgi:sec-independent protein translocase protein TatC